MDKEYSKLKYLKFLVVAIYASENFRRGGVSGVSSLIFTTTTQIKSSPNPLIQCIFIYILVQTIPSFVLHVILSLNTCKLFRCFKFNQTRLYHVQVLIKSEIRPVLNSPIDNTGEWGQYFCGQYLYSTLYLYST